MSLTLSNKNLKNLKFMFKNVGINVNKNNLYVTDS